MPKRIINEGILVIRDGKRVRPEIGKTFNLTDEEIKQLEAIRPEAIAKLRQVEDDPRSSDDDDDGKGDGLEAAKTEDGKGDSAAKTAAPANNKTGGKGTVKAGAKASGNADGL